MVGPTMLEVCACREALAMAEDLHLTKLFVVSDCQELVKETNHECFTRGDYSMIMREVQTWCQNFQVSIFRHEWCEANGNAHNLVRVATSMGMGRYVWFANPPTNICISILVNQ